MTRRPWTDEEIARLRGLAGIMTADEIGEKLDRTAYSVQKAATRNGISLIKAVVVRDDRVDAQDWQKTTRAQLELSNAAHLSALVRAHGMPSGAVR